MKIISRIKNSALYPLARVIVGMQSINQRIRTLGESPQILIEGNYSGQPILLLALFQKGQIRPDLVRLMREAKNQGLYVLAVNTLRLEEHEALAGLADCYIERSNFGRDFGSYKVGFSHIYAREWEANCSRLLVMNDSVYFSSRGLKKFISDLSESKVEVLGGTENFEIEYHLGSFCISIAQNILRAPQLKSYWRKYRLTDVRPIVIKQGEMKLSKTLKRCVSTSSSFQALYSSDRFLNEVKSNHVLQDLIIRDSRTGAYTPWPRFEIETLYRLLSGKVISRNHVLAEGVEVNIDAPVNEMSEEVVVTGRSELLRYILRHVPERSEAFDEIFSDALAATATDIFMMGSQIHQNAAILLELGLPIIKLDGLYRGMFNNYDVLRLQKKLNENEARELSSLLLDRPYGGQMLNGWRRAAFMRGLI